MKRKHIVLLTLIVWALASTALASAVNGGHLDEFGIQLQGKNEYVEGWGTGWRSPDTQMQWFLYDAPTTPTPQPNPWWNQWFYDDPPTSDRWKYIKYTIFVDLLPNSNLVDPEIGINIALNWSNMKYPETGPDGRPPMPDEEWAIERKAVFPDDVIISPVDPSYTFTGEFIIPDYNPEWVSIDVYAWALGYEPGTTNQYPMQVTVSGEVYHECIPEPATITLLSFGALALLKRKR
jgi:hypothetical protein